MEAERRKKLRKITAVLREDERTQEDRNVRRKEKTIFECKKKEEIKKST